MKKYINYINESTEDKYDKLFLELAHLNELRITFDLIELENTIYYIYNKKPLFDYSKNGLVFYIDYDEIWLFFEKIDSNDNIIDGILRPLIKKYLNIDLTDILISPFSA